MTPRFLAPGVYVEEVSRGVRPIPGAATGVTAFLGFAPSLPRGEVVGVDSWRQLEERLAAAPGEHALAGAVRAFFDNGGRRALVAGLQGSLPSALEAGLEVLTGAPWDLLCLPLAAAATGAGAAFGGLGTAGISAAARTCERRRALLILDADPSWANVAEAIAGRATLGHLPNAALYHPWLRDAGGALLPPCGFVAGVMARTDAARGVWKAPAGTEAALRGAVEPSQALTNRDSDLLNPAGINALRTFGGAAPVIWGARTLSTNPEWRYLPVRRLALFLERSLEQATRWVIFEPNGESLWNHLQVAVGTFLDLQWRHGALQGATPEEAYFVRCGPETTTRSELDQGKLHLLVGFAPLEPAEFILLRLTLSTDAGRSEALLPIRDELEEIAIAAERPPSNHEDEPVATALQALFSGPGGSGKTLAARALGQRLKRPLFLVDLAGPVSRYIGETEKNLERLFAAAGERSGILFFDEADALFGKRSEIADARDRYANIEISHLLHCLEQFTGLVILATSRPERLEGVFVERSRFRVAFPE